LKSVSQMQIKAVPCSRIRTAVCVVKQIAGKVRQLQNDSSATSACRSVGRRTARPGEASNAATKFQTTGDIGVDGQR
jgi:hypothetical protein